jgi:hypothetical protein
VVVDQPIEWGQEGGATFEPRGRGIGVDPPHARRSLDLDRDAGLTDELGSRDAECTEPALVAHRSRL